MKKALYVFLGFCFAAALAWAGSIKVWSSTDIVKNSDLNANFAHIHNVMVGGHGARLVDADVSASAAIQWTKLASGGASTVGSFNLFTTALTVNATNYSGFQMAGTMSSGIKFGQVTCTTVTTVGAGTPGTLAIYDATSSAVLCSGTFSCTVAPNTSQAVFNCNAIPTASHLYVMRFTTACGTTMPTGLSCNIEIEH